MENVLTKEQAAKEISAWLDYKRVKAAIREKKADSINVLVDGLVSGDISIAQEDYFVGAGKLQGPVITHKLLFPCASITELKYKPRETAGNLTACINNVNSVAACYASALTSGLMPAQLSELDSEDMRIVQAVVSFFL